MTSTTSLASAVDADGAEHVCLVCSGPALMYCKDCSAYWCDADFRRVHERSRKFSYHSAVELDVPGPSNDQTTSRSSSSDESEALEGATAPSPVVILGEADEEAVSPVAAAQENGVGEPDGDNPPMFIPLCSLCEDEPSTQHCNDCSASYCADCGRDMHKPRKFASHCLVAIAERGKSVPPQPLQRSRSMREAKSEAAQQAAVKRSHHRHTDSFALTRTPSTGTRSLPVSESSHVIPSSPQKQLTIKEEDDVAQRGLCENCEAVAFEYHCSQCNQWLCQDCNTAMHRPKIKRAHNPRRISSDLNPAASPSPDTEVLHQLAASVVQLRDEVAEWRSQHQQQQRQSPLPPGVSGETPAVSPAPAVGSSPASGQAKAPSPTPVAGGVVQHVLAYDPTTQTQVLVPIAPASVNSPWSVGSRPDSAHSNPDPTAQGSPAQHSFGPVRPMSAQLAPVRASPMLTPEPKAATTVSSPASATKSNDELARLRAELAATRAQMETLLRRQEEAAENRSKNSPVTTLGQYQAQVASPGPVDIDAITAAVVSKLQAAAAESQSSSGRSSAGKQRQSKKKNKGKRSRSNSVNDSSTDEPSVEQTARARRRERRKQQGTAARRSGTQVELVVPNVKGLAELASDLSSDFNTSGELDDLRQEAERLGTPLAPDSSPEERRSASARSPEPEHRDPVPPRLSSRSSGPRPFVVSKAPAGSTFEGQHTGRTRTSRPKTKKKRVRKGSTSSSSRSRSRSGSRSSSARTKKPKKKAKKKAKKTKNKSPEQDRPPSQASGSRKRSVTHYSRTSLDKKSDLQAAIRRQGLTRRSSSMDAFSPSMDQPLTAKHTLPVRSKAGGTTLTPSPPPARMPELSPEDAAVSSSPVTGPNKARRSRGLRVAESSDNLPSYMQPRGKHSTPSPRRSLSLTFMQSRSRSSTRSKSRSSSSSKPKRKSQTPKTKRNHVRGNSQPDIAWMSAAVAEWDAEDGDSGKLFKRQRSLPTAFSAKSPASAMSPTVLYATPSPVSAASSSSSSVRGAHSRRSKSSIPAQVCQDATVLQHDITELRASHGSPIRRRSRSEGNLSKRRERLHSKSGLFSRLHSGEMRNRPQSSLGSRSRHAYD